MSMLLKSLIGLAVALPVAAFVVGSLVVSDDSQPRERIVIEDDSSPVGDDGESEDLGREQEPARKPSGDADDDDAEDGPEGDTDDAGGSAATDDAVRPGPAATEDGPAPRRDGTDERARVPGVGGGANGHDERDDDTNAGVGGDDSGDDSGGDDD